MAATVELLKRLDSDGEPIAKRLCLAQNVFHSMQLPLPRKEESITNWLCQVAGKFKEKSKRKSLSNSSDDFVKLWSTLRSCVANPAFNTADIRPSIKTYLIEVLSKQLKRKDLSQNEALIVTECAITVLKAKSFQSYYGANTTLFINFVNNLLKSLSIECAEHASLIHSILSSFEYIVRNVKPTDELRLIFLDEMLFTLADLLKSDKSQSAPVSKTISRCVKQVLFPTTSSDFFEFLAANISESGSDKQFPVPAKLLTILQEARSTLDEDSYITLLNMIFTSFSTGNIRTVKEPSACVFPMCVLVSYLVGLEVKNQKCLVSYKRLKNVCKKGELKSMSLSVFSNMIQILAQWGISLTTTINGTSFSDWIKVLVESLFSTPSSFDLVSFLKLMSSLLKLDPYLVENYLKKILDVIMANPLSEEVKPTYTTFISDVLAFYHKLGRSPHFIKTFVECLQEGFKKQQESNILPPSQNMWLSSGLIQQLLDDATVMPSASLIRVLNFLIIQCETNVELNEDVPLNDGYRNLLIHTVCEILSATLRGVRMLELSSTETAREQFCSVMTRIKNQLGSFGKFVQEVDNNNYQAISSFLNVSYHWAAGAILIEQYADAGREELLESVGTNLSTECQDLHGGGILSYLHPYLSSSEWESIYDKIINLEDEDCKRLLLKLDIQLLSALLLFNTSQSALSKVVAKRACALMVQWPTDVCDRDTIANVVLMAPMLDASELSSLGEWLTPSLLAGQNDSSLQDVMTLLTEERLVSCGLVCSVLNSLSRKMKVSKRKKDESGVKFWRVAKTVFGKLDTKAVIQQELEGLLSEKMSSVLSSMASPLSDALPSLDGCQVQLPAEESDLNNLLQHLRMLQSFPLRYFTTGCKGVVFFSLLSVAVDCSALAPSEMKNSILQEIFEHLLLGLYEKGQHLSPKLKGYVDHGALIGALAYFVVNHNVGRRLLELLLDQALHQELSQEPILERILVMKSEGKKQTPCKENLLLGTLFLQVTAETKLKPVCPLDASVNLDESTSNPQKDLKKVRKKIVKSFENLIQHKLLNAEDELLAFSLVLEYYLSLEKEVGDLLSEFERFICSAVVYLNSSERAQIEAAESFIVTVCRHRQKLAVVPEVLVKDVWSHLTQSNQPNETVLKAIIQAATDDETSFIISDLLSKTQHLNFDQDLKDDKCSSNVVQIWSMMLRFNTLTTVHKKSPIALRDMFRLYQLGKLPLQQLLGFLNDFLMSQKVKLHMQTVDLCFLILHDVQLPQTLKEFIPAAKQFLSVLSAVFLHHLHLALDCVPSFLQMLQRLVCELAKASMQRPELSRAESAELAGVAFEAEKLITAFTKPDLKKSLARVSAYFLADLLAIFETTILCPPVKKHFDNMVYVLMSILDKYAFKFLLRAMSTSSTAIFNNFEKSYKKFHLFKGKV